MKDFHLLFSGALLPNRPHPNPSPKGEGLKKARFPLSFRRGGQGVRSRGHQAFLPLFLLAALPAGGAVDPFYQSLLRDGQHAYDRKDYTAAARDLRLACFGMLDEPRQLVDCLARLALAQDRLDDSKAFSETFQRLVELEERFKAYSQAELAPELRTTLEQRLAARIPAATLAAAPAFRSTVPVKTEPAPAAKEAKNQPRGKGTEKGNTRPALPPARNPAAPAAGADNPTAPSSGHPPAAGAPATEDAPQTPPAVAATAPANPPAAAPLAEAERGKLDEARRLLAERRTARELREAYQLAREVADAHSELRGGAASGRRGSLPDLALERRGHLFPPWRRSWRRRARAALLPGRRLLRNGRSGRRRRRPQALALQSEAHALRGLLCKEDPGTMRKTSAVPAGRPILG